MKPFESNQLLGELEQTLRHAQTHQVHRDVFKTLVKAFWLMEQDNEVESHLYQLRTLLQKYSVVSNRHFDFLLSFEGLKNGDVFQNIFQEVGEFLSLQGDLETCLFISSWPKECLNHKMIASGGQSICKGIVDVICRSKLKVKQISKLRDMISKVEVFLMTLFIMEQSLELFCLKEIFTKLFSFTVKCEKKSEPILSLLVGGIMQNFDPHLINDVIHLCVHDLGMTFNTSSTKQKEVEENDLLIAIGSCIFHWMNLPYSSCIGNIAIAYCRALVFNRRLVPLVNILTKEMDKLCLLIKLPITRKAALKLYVNLQLSFRTNPMFFNRHCDELTSLIAYLKQAKGTDMAFIVQTLTSMVHCLLKFHPKMLMSASNLMQVIEPHGRPTGEQLEKMLADNISIFEVGSLDLSAIDATLMCTRGLLNLGNTCYINCIVQCLYACTSFSREILQSPLYSGQFAKSLQFTFANLLLSKRVICTPNDVVNCSKKFFSFGLQHDCSEFFTYYLDKMSEEFAQSNGSLVTRNFHGSMRNTIRCLECNAQSSKRENFSSLPISIPADSQWLDEGMAHDLSSLVEDHFKQEMLDGDNKYLCCQCNKMVRALKSHFVVSPPAYLVIVLLRFHFDTQSRCRKKVNAPITCSKLVKLPFDAEESLGKNCQSSSAGSSSQKCIIYELKALTIHSGATLEFGHYYSLFSCSEPASGKASWYLADDAKVRPISTQEFIRITSEMPMQTPYVLFLAREDRAHNSALSKLDVTPSLKKMVEETNKVFENEQKFRGLYSNNPTTDSKSRDPKDDEDEFPTQMSFCNGPRLIF